MNGEGKKKLTVHMLGRFSLQYGDEVLSLGRNSASKLAQLLQILWLSGEKGIGRDDLVGMLYDRDSLSSLNNSLNISFTACAMSCRWEVFPSLSMSSIVTESISGIRRFRCGWMPENLRTL